MHATTLAAETALHTAFLQHHPVEAAHILENLAPNKAGAILSGYEAALLAPVCEALSPAAVDELLDELPEALTADTFEHMPPARSAGLLRAISAERRARLVAALSPAVQRDVNLLLECEPDTAGAVMDPRIMYLRRDMRVGDALARLRELQFHRRFTRALRIMLIVDESGRLEGIIAIQDLAIADPDDVVQEYMQPVPAFVSMTAKKDEIVKQMDEHHVSSLPVVDEDQRLIGTVRYEELVAAAKEEAVGDIQAMFGVSRDEQALSPPLFAVRKRLPWLEINLATAFLAAAVVGLFEDTIAKFTALAVLLPVVAGQSGNTGAQALAVAMRGLALNEISVKHWPKVLAKELITGIVNGIAIALTVALVTYLWSQSIGLTLVIGLAMVLSMVIASLAGAAMPLILTRLGQDPAQSSSIILTTVTDVAGFFSFLGIASLFVKLL